MKITPDHSCGKASEAPGEEPAFYKCNSKKEGIPFL